MRLQKTAWILFFLSAAVSMPLQAICAAKPDTTIYEVKLKSKAGDAGVRKMCMKAPYFAWESKGGGISFKVVKNKDGTFLYHTMLNYAAKYPPGSNRESPMACLPGPVGNVKAFLAKNKAKKSGTEKVNKKSLDIYTYKETVTSLDCKLYVDPKTLTPVKLVMLGEKPDSAITATYATYKRNIEVPDSQFEFPKGVRIGSIRPPSTSEPPVQQGGN